MNNYVDFESVILGTGDIFVIDSDSNLDTITRASSASDLLGRVDNVKLSTKRTFKSRKRPVKGVLMDTGPKLVSVYTSISFDIFEHNKKTFSILFGGGSEDSDGSMGFLTKNPKNVRMEVKFRYPLTGKILWFIFPICLSVSDLIFNPVKSSGFVQTGEFTVLPVTTNTNWNSATTKLFNNYVEG